MTAAAAGGHSGRRIVANPARADLRRAGPQYDLPLGLFLWAVGFGSAQGPPVPDRQTEW